MLCLFFFLFVSQLFLSLSFPLLLGGFILVFGVLVATLMLFNVGALFSVSFFLTLVGGILVVFAYTIALTTWEKDKKDKKEGIMKMFSFFLFCFFLFMIWLVSVSSKSWIFYKSSNVLYFYSEWGLAISLLSIFLFLIMVIAVSLAGKFEGPLIK